MQGIADWLKQLGLGQYTQRFAENEVDVTVLRHLTDQDLREIGVPLGHRRKILAAIREDMGSTTPVTSDPLDHLEPTSQASPERRQITVMFSDIVGWTALSSRMDPEDLRELISAYQKCVAEAVHRYGGLAQDERPVPPLPIGARQQTARDHARALSEMADTATRDSARCPSSRAALGARAFKECLAVLEDKMGHVN